MNILGVSAYFHDSAACLVSDGRISGAAQEEWFTRRKHDPSFPVNAAQWCLGAAGMSWEDVDWFAYYELPSLKAERVRASSRASGARVEGGRYTRDLQRDIGRAFPAVNPASRVYAVEHHLAHAASAFYPSPFEEAAVVTVDGVGEFATTTISRGRGNGLEPLLQQCFPHSLGLFYSAFTHYCGFKVNSGEYKLMGLAPYGVPRHTEVIEANVIRIGDDGTYRLNMDYFDFLDPGADQLENSRLGKLLGRPRRSAESAIDEFHCDVAASVQAVFEKAVLGIARHAKAVTGSEHLCLAGGSALNCVANRRIREDGGFAEIWVQPAASDAGGGLGAALHLWHHRLGEPREPQGADAMRGALLGPSFDEATVRRYLDSVSADYELMDEEKLVRRTAERLADGKIVAWFQGRQEFGPRALGSRSILADPRSPVMQRHLNLVVKNRESFRPFAPAVLEEAAADYFDLPVASPYMLFTAEVRPEHRLAADTGGDPLESAARVRSIVPAVTHVDHSARVQTVNRDDHPLFWALISAFAELTGVPMLVNTSLNVRGEPIVCTPEDALKTFLRTEIDYLCMGGAVLDRRRQSGAAVTADPIAALD